jgi:hypothetical protein
MIPGVSIPDATATTAVAYMPRISSKDTTIGASIGKESMTGTAMDGCKITVSCSHTGL